ncbi:MAG: hypothetical protein ACREIV_02810, partial [Planctomycetaceae bacterium]
GDSFKKVQTGEPLRIPAETFNTFIDAARDFKARRQSLGRTAQLDFRQAGIVPVKNGSGSDRNRFDVLGIQRPIFTPADNLASFQNQVALVGKTPSDADHFGRFVILLEPLRDGTIGRGCISGVCPVRLNVLDEEHDWADVEDGENDSLKTDDAGGAFILWKEPPGSGYGGYGYGYYYGGLRWALVRLSNFSDSDQWGTV